MKMPKLTSSELKEFLHFAYMHSLSEDFNGNLVVLLDVAQGYEIEDLKTLCHRRLIAKLDQENAIETLSVAFTYELELLKKVAAAFIAAHWKELMKGGQLRSFVACKKICDLVARYAKLQQAVKID